MSEVESVEADLARHDTMSPMERLESFSSDVWYEHTIALMLYVDELQAELRKIDVADDKTAIEHSDLQKRIQELQEVNRAHHMPQQTGQSGGYSDKMAQLAEQRLRAEAEFRRNEAKARNEMPNKPSTSHDWPTYHYEDWRKQVQTKSYTSPRGHSAQGKSVPPSADDFSRKSKKVR